MIQAQGGGDEAVGQTQGTKAVSLHTQTRAGDERDFREEGRK